MNEEEEYLFPFDPEIERTLLKRRRELKKSHPVDLEVVEMGEN
jgi:hypothetical protein